MIGYKGFNSLLKCKNYQFTENIEHVCPGPVILFAKGFHFCDVPINVLDYYNDPTDKYAIIEASGNIESFGNTLVANKIKIIKIITKEELINECSNKSFHVRTGEYHFTNNQLHSINDKPAKIYHEFQEWYLNGKLHRDNDLPAKIRNNGDQTWYQHGIIHRDNDKPAKILASGLSFWYKNGLLHRENDKPARVCKNGDQEWYINGLLHRENDKPAAIYNNGNLCWYKNGLLHRDNDLPAKIYANKYQYWYENGKLIK